MRQLFRSTTVYRALAESAARNEAAHFTLVLFADAKYLRAFLTECAKAFFAFSFIGGTPLPGGFSRPRRRPFFRPRP